MKIWKAIQPLFSWISKCVPSVPYTDVATRYECPYSFGPDDSEIRLSQWSPVRQECVDVILYNPRGLSFQRTDEVQWCHGDVEIVDGRSCMVNAFPGRATK